MIFERNKDEGTIAFKNYNQKNEIEVIGDVRSTIAIKSLTCVPSFQGYSFEELKLIDYNYTAKTKGVTRVFGINPPVRLGNSSNSNGNAPLGNQYPSTSTNNVFANANSTSTNPFNVNFASSYTNTTSSSNPFANANTNTNTYPGVNSNNTFSNSSNANSNYNQNNYFTSNIGAMNPTAPFNNTNNINPFLKTNTNDPFASNNQMNGALPQFANPIQTNTGNNNNGCNLFNNNPQNNNPFASTTTTTSNPFSYSQNTNPFNTHTTAINLNSTSTNPFNTNANPFNLTHSNNTATNPFNPTSQSINSSSNPYVFGPNSIAPNNPFQPNTHSNPLTRPMSSMFDKYINQLNNRSDHIDMPPSFYYPFQNSNHPLPSLSINPFTGGYNAPSQLSNLMSHNSDKEGIDLKSKLNVKKEEDDSTSFNMKKIEQYLIKILKKTDSNKEEYNEIPFQNEVSLSMAKDAQAKKKVKAKAKILRTIKLHQLNHHQQSNICKSSVNRISFNDTKTSLRDIRSYIMKEILQKNQTSFFFLVDDVLLYKDKDKTPLENMSDIINDCIWFDIQKRESKGVSIDLSPNSLNQFKEFQLQKDKDYEDNQEQDKEKADEEEEDKDLSYVPIITTLSTQPSADELKEMSKKQLSQLSNFSIYNDNGRINFLAPVDITYLDIDSIVKIEPFFVSVYLNEIPPKAGTKINQKAQIEIYNFSKEEKKASEEEEEMPIMDLIKANLKQNGGIFISFNDGILKFKLDSFAS